MDHLEIKTINQPKDLKVNLYPHQLASIYKMETLEREKQIIGNDKITETNIGINSDITGYGKTFSMIGLIVRDKMIWDDDTPYVFNKITLESGGRIKNITFSRHEKLNTTLILAGPSIIRQWVAEFKKTSLKVCKITTRNEVDNVDPDDYDVIIIVPNMFNRLMNTFLDVAWKRFIFDEPGHLRVSAMKKIIAGFYWLVTATPYNIITQHRNCTSSFMYELVCSSNTHTNFYDFDRLFGKMIIKNEENFVKQSFTMPETFYHNHYCYNPLYVAIKGIAKPQITEMINAGDISGAIRELGGKKTDNITELIKKQKQEELHMIETEIKISDIRLDNARKQKWIDRKTRIEEQIKDLDDRYSKMIKGDCNICFETISSPVLEPNCQNIFCGKCLLKWLEKKNTCPLCRNIVKTEDLIIQTDDIHEKNDIKLIEKKYVTKENKIADIITNKDGKFIIFSANDNSFISIRNILNEHNITYTEVKGNSNKRVQKIDDFKNGNTKVIFLNSSNNGAGINLQETTDIIIYHEMSESTLNQIIGRANRIGRTVPLNVHHLVLS